ncbi:hypothetical protein D1159_14840 [Pseudoflavonifractor sp. 524-17]|uniref:hypothetical protein n=1 Tax=Pseudoflavonifractor sp. 524-17 TaxID=2304577 RepID=UPI00137AACF1|nr:hypothetical protein [Pseudoflavonifractor sp. 524-17]NCE65817.1 hypothetical protein [Pseudoflavonifractor sp. 524-17]
MRGTAEGQHPMERVLRESLKGGARRQAELRLSGAEAAWVRANAPSLTCVPLEAGGNGPRWYRISAGGPDREEKGGRV